MTRGAFGQARAAVAELAAEIGLAGDAGPALEQQAAIEARIVGGAAAQDQDALEAGGIGIEQGGGLAKVHRAILADMGFEQGAQHARLFVDLLEHESFEAGAFRGFGAQGDRLDHGLDGRAIEGGQGHAGGAQFGDFAVVEIDDLLDAVQDGGHVAGDELLALAHADDEGAAAARGVENVRLVAEHDAEGVGPLGAAQRLADRLGGRLAAALQNLFDQVAGSLPCRSATGTRAPWLSVRRAAPHRSR
jgi:hypothetical protein